MDDDQRLERLIKENLRVTKENNRRLRGIQRGMFLGGIFKIIIWAIILGIPIFLYFSIFKPYVEGATETFEKIKSGDASIFEQIVEIPGLNAFRNSLESNQSTTE